jgi:CubicO group peptidase (beta-lactamase class C family)
MCCLVCVGHATDLRPEQTDAIFAKLSQPGAPGCAVGVLERGETRHRKGYGLADVEQNVALTPESRFYLASVSKQFTALAALIAEKEGKLSLDDPLSKHVPEMPAYAAKIPLRRMLDHTAGLRDYLALWDLKGWSNNSALQPEPTLALIARQQALDFEPGTDYSYSNSGYFLMSVVIERTTGRNLGDYLEEKVFRPLGMSATRVQHDHMALVPNRAHGYAKAEAGFRLLDVNFDVMGSGGVYSNVDDLLKWARNFDERKVAGDLLDRLSDPGKLADGRETPTGYAFGLRRTKFGDVVEISHGGSAPGYRTFFARYPEQKVAVVALCNGDANSQAIAQQTAAVWLGVRMPEAPAPLKSEVGLPARAMSGLLGAWWSPELESVWRFEERGGQVFLLTDGRPRLVTETAQGKLRAGSATLSMGEVALTVDTGRARGIRFTRYKP